MFVRLGSFEVIPGKLTDLRRIYLRDCVPIVKDAPGNLDAYLMEPTEADGPVLHWPASAAPRRRDTSRRRRLAVGRP